VIDILIKNALICGDDFAFFRGDIRANGTAICEIASHLNTFPHEQTIDAAGLRLLPGLIDIHTHGALGYDASDGRAESLRGIAKHLLAHGVTTFCPTTMTLPQERLVRCMETIAACKEDIGGAKIHGAHLEGPYISHAKKGAQDPRYIRKPSADEIDQLRNLAPVDIISLAPEADGALAFARAMAGKCVLSAAHTNATYEEAIAGFAAGFTHATHLFAAMSPLHHRAPGVPGAVFDSPRVTAELICDGVHLSPVTLRLAFCLLGEDRAAAVSDAVAPAGLPEGAYSIGGQVFVRKNGAVYMEDGETLAGSSCDMLRSLQNLIAFGIPERAAIKACTINPAKVIGAQNTIGSVKIGKQADLILTDENYNLVTVVLGGIVQDILHA
jgi:N-acetylglucosamine-6-phosphate deacetylase